MTGFKRHAFVGFLTYILTFLLYHLSSFFQNTATPILLILMIDSIIEKNSEFPRRFFLASMMFIGLGVLVTILRLLFFFINGELA